MCIFARGRGAMISPRGIGGRVRGAAPLKLWTSLPFLRLQASPPFAPGNKGFLAGGFFANPLIKALDDLELSDERRDNPLDA